MDLIENALTSICGVVNSYLHNLDPRPDAWLILTSLVDHDGSLNQATRDKIVMCVYNITREVFAGSYQSTVPMKVGAELSAGLPVISPPIYLDLHIMFMANFTERGYRDGLAVLSRLIGFFQQTPVFTQQNTPGLAAQFDKLTLDLENLSAMEVNYVMGMLGTRYLPSAFYKLRMIPFASPAMLARTYAVGGDVLAAGPSGTGG